MSFYDHYESVGWFDRIHKYFSEEDIKKLRSEYHDEEVIWKLKPGGRTKDRIVSRAYNLAEATLVKDGSKADIRLALEYFIICLDSERYLLDWKKYRRDKGILELERKYLAYA